jgi:hypothetical protein
MKSYLYSLLIIGAVSHSLHGHGLAFRVEVEHGRLIVKHSETSAFAPPIFAQNNANDDFSEFLELESVGNIALWDKPGFDLHGPDEQFNLSIELLSRPVIGSPAAQRRVLWYWNPLDGVTESPTDFHLFGTNQRYSTIEADSETAAEPFVLANTLAGQTGFHNHTLLYYGLALDKDFSAPQGIYGFFARLTSNGYDDSDPFLVLFNFLTPHSQMQAASLAIHTASTLPGDYDLDDDIDGRDFLLWQQLVGSTTRTVADASLNGVVDVADLAVWQQNYGTQFGEFAAPSMLQVPEPNPFTMIMAIAILRAGSSRSRSRKRN